MIKVSIVSGVYNREKYLDKLITSFLKQTYENIEIILINNGSKDNSQKIIDKYIKEYPNRFICYETDVGLGAGGSRKKGMEFVTGDYISFVDSDDYIGEHYIEDLVSAIDEKDLPDIVIGNFTKVDAQGNAMYERTYRNTEEALYQSIAPWGKLFRRGFFYENNLELRNMPFAEDVIFSIEVILNNPSVLLANSNQYYWLNNLNSTSNVEFRGFPQNALSSAFEYLDYIKQKYTSNKPLLDYFAVKYFVWYLLHSGRNVGSQRMTVEYNAVFEYLDKQFPNYKKCKFISLFRPKYERKIVRIVVWTIVAMKKVGVSRLFFSTYSRMNVDKLWPKL